MVDADRAQRHVYGDWGAASALGVVLLVMTIGILWRIGRLIGSTSDGRALMLSPAATETQSRMCIGCGSMLSVALIVLFLIAPTLLVCRSVSRTRATWSFRRRAGRLRWYEAYFGSIEWREATVRLLRGSHLTMIVSTILGTMAAYGMHMLRGGCRGAYAVFTLPMIIPGILIAIGIFMFYAQLGLNNTLTGIVLAHSVLAIPLVVITVASSLKSYDMNQEMVARSLGASRLWAFSR